MQWNFHLLQSISFNTFKRFQSTMSPSMNITDATTHEFKYPNLPNLLDIKKLDLRIKGPSYLDYSAVEYSNNVSSYSFGRYGRQNIRDNRSKDAQDVITFIGHQVETISLRFDTDRDIIGNYLEMILALFLSVQHIEVYGGMIKVFFPIVSVAMFRIWHHWY